MRSILVCLALANPAFAQDALSGTDFENFVEGKTLGYSVGSNTPYGTERYMQNRRVIWTTIDGRCTTGVWFDRSEQICFRYDDDDTDKCWYFFPQGDGLVGIFEHELGRAYGVDVIGDDELFACDRFTS